MLRAHQRDAAKGSTCDGRYCHVCPGSATATRRAVGRAGASDCWMARRARCVSAMFRHRNTSRGYARARGVYARGLIAGAVPNEAVVEKIRVVMSFTLRSTSYARECRPRALSRIGAPFWLRRSQGPFDFRIHLAADQDGDTGEKEPEQQNHNGRHRAVSLGVGVENAEVRLEAERREEPTTVPGISKRQWRCWTFGAYT